MTARRVDYNISGTFMTKKKVGFMVAALCLISVVMIVCSILAANNHNYTN